MESVLHRHYKLGQQLFANTLGELYLGRDLISANHHLLIHCLPLAVLTTSALKRSLNLLQKLGAQADAPILPVLDCAWSDTNACFILKAPQNWALTALPPIQGNPTKLHQKALSITATLLKQNLVKQGLEPNLFMVTAEGELHLLGTALLPELQDYHTHSTTVLNPKTVRNTTKKSRFSSLLAFGTTGLAVAGGLAFYQFTPTFQPTPQVPSLPPKSTIHQASTLDTPASSPNPPLVITTAQKPVLLASAVPIAIEQASALGSTAPPHPNTQELALNSSPSETTASLNIAPSEKFINSESPSTTLSPHPATMPTNTNDAMDTNTLQYLERARDAIEHNRLQTGVYYLRLAKKLNAEQTRLKPLAQEIIQRAQIKSNEVLSPQMQEAIKQEFMLN